MCVRVPGVGVAWPLLVLVVLRSLVGVPGTSTMAGLGAFLSSISLFFLVAPASKVSRRWSISAKDINFFIPSSSTPSCQHRRSCNTCMSLPLSLALVHSISIILAFPPSPFNYFFNPHQPLLSLTLLYPSL